MNIKEILSKKSELETAIHTIDNHLARAEARGSSTISIDGYYPISISVPEVDTILVARRERHQAELDRIDKVINAMEKVAESMLAEGTDGL